MRRALFSSSVVTSLAFSVSLACAEPPPTNGQKAPTPAATAGNEDAKRRAEALFEKGVAAYNQGRFYDAIDIFLEVNRIFPNPQLSFNVAKAYDNVGDQGGALRAYREYLKRMPEAADKKEVSTRIRQLEVVLGQKGLQQLTVSSQPEGATILLDGRPIGITPWTGETGPGRHRIQLRSAGYRDSEEIVELERQRSREVALVMAPVLAETKPKSDPVPADERSRSNVLPKQNIGVMTWAAFAVGAASFAGALLVQINQSGNDSGMSRSAAFLAGIGTTSAVAGGVMLYFNLSGPPSRNAARVGLRVNETDF